jgi:hypothetical protein
MQWTVAHVAEYCLHRSVNAMSKRVFNVFALFAGASLTPFVAAAAAPNARAFANPDLPPEKRIDDLVATLTLDENIECLASRPR